MESREFKHDTLNQSVDEIRLIVLEPCIKDEVAVKCKIRNANLNANPQYEALSYMWGSDTDSKVIEIDGKELRIGQNLWLALLKLRYPDKERTLWIDAICINQQNISERNHQVGLMSLIYSQAQRVVAWLGPGTHQSRIAISFLTQINDGFIPVPECDQPRYKPQWDAVKSFCKIPYWKRLWIIQELVLSYEVIFQCGRDMLPGATLIGARDALSQGHDHTWWNSSHPKEFQRTLPARLLQHRRSKIALGYSFKPLIDLLLEFKGTECKDPRDRLFGLHSLAMVCCRKFLPIDYSKSILEICKGAMAHYSYKHHKNFRPFTGEAMLVYLVNLTSGESRPKPISTIEKNEFEAEDTSWPMRRHRGTIIYTTPLDAVFALPLYRHADPDTLTQLNPSQKLYVESVWKILGHVAVTIPDVESIYRSSVYESTSGLSERLSHIQGTMASLPSSHAMQYIYQDISIEQYTPGHILMAEVPTEVCRWWEGGRDLIERHILLLRELLGRYPHRYLPPSQIMLFIDNNGIIGCAPRGTQAGDTIWQDSSPEHIAIVRRTDSGYKTVVRSPKVRYSRTSEQIIRDEKEWQADHPTDYNNRRWYDDMLNCHLTFVSVPYQDAISASPEGSGMGIYQVGAKRQKNRQVERKRTSKKPRRSRGIRKGG